MKPSLNAIANQKSKILNPIGKSVNRSIGKSPSPPLYDIFRDAVTSWLSPEPEATETQEENSHE